MTRRPRISSIHACILPALVALSLAACVTQSTPPQPDAKAASNQSAASMPGMPAVPASPALLPKVPQPPERPVAPPSVTDPSIPQAQRIAAFVDYTARTYGVDPQRVRDTLAQAEFRQSIIDAMNRPAEKTRTWAEYRPIFLNHARISGGRAFLARNRAALARVEAQTGVPAEYIVAIIGVETSYGSITGNYRVLDAIYTLAFGYPKRAPFFAGELAQLFALNQAEPQLDLATLKGSYAGAMGMGQFMPSSYRLWAKDGDGDGRRNLLDNLPDVFASIAHYFVVHGWQRGGPVVARAVRTPDAAEFDPDSLEPVFPLADLAARGYRPRPGEPVTEGATLVTFEGDGGKEYWLGYRNFYVISRYNHSPKYAMAVHQLAQAIASPASP